MVPNIDHSLYSYVVARSQKQINYNLILIVELERIASITEFLKLKAERRSS